MSTKTEGRHTAEFLVSEANGFRSRDQVTVTVPASTTLKAGRVMSQHAGTGKYLPFDNAGSDGTEEANSVLLEELVNDEVTAVDMDGVVVNCDAEVRTADLEWGSVDASGQTAGLADLRLVGIKAR